MRSTLCNVDATMSSRDARFKSLSSDPRFIKPKKVAQKVQVDERFANLLEDASSQDKNRVDKFGRRSKTNQKEKEDLKRFYKVEDGPEAGGSSSSKGKVKETLSAGERALKMARGELVEESSDESESELESNSNSGAVEEEEDDEDSALSGSEASGSEFSVNLSEDEDITNFPDAEDVDEEGEAEEITTTRLALVNMDWDHIRAVDLFKVLQSALTAVHPQGAVHRLSIYPSEFGKERMAREEKEGPPAELFATAEGREVKEQDIDEDDVDERMILKEQQDKGEEINSKALRRYQLERLRYFYAVAEFDSVKSARAAFLETQGTEFERSANVFELRYV